MLNIFFYFVLLLFPPPTLLAHLGTLNKTRRHAIPFQFIEQFVHSGTHLQHVTRDIFESNVVQSNTVLNDSMSPTICRTHHSHSTTQSAHHVPPNRCSQRAGRPMHPPLGTRIWFHQSQYADPERKAESHTQHIASGFVCLFCLRCYPYVPPPCNRLIVLLAIALAMFLTNSCKSWIVPTTN